MTPVLAEATDGAVTLPWFVWSAIGVGLVSAVVWLARTWKASVDATNTQMVALVREVVAAANTMASAVKENTGLLVQLQRQIEQRP